MIKDNELHVTCSCGTHELHFEKDRELPVWYISFWQRGYLNGQNWQYRLRCVWHILIHGRPFGDEVVLEEKDLRELQEFVQAQLDKKDA